MHRRDHDTARSCHNGAVPQETFLDRYRAAVREGSYAFPLSELIGFHLIEVDPGRAVIRLDTGPQHSNPMGTVHGGVLATVADTAMGVAHASLLGEGESSTTIDLQVNYLRPVLRGTIQASAKAVRHGRTITYLECDVTDGEGVLVARASSTCMTLRGDAAKGR
jgi:uncharacterized protein (TIGR00369 family)